MQLKYSFTAILSGQLHAPLRYFQALYEIYNNSSCIFSSYTNHYIFEKLRILSFIDGASAKRIHALWVYLP
jgi:hypothetical protein